MPTTANSFQEFAERVDYSLLEKLRPDPDATADGNDHRPRPVFSGHWVPVTPTPIPEPEYVAHSHTLFAELGLDDGLAHEVAQIEISLSRMSVCGSPTLEWSWRSALSTAGRDDSASLPGAEHCDRNLYYFRRFDRGHGTDTPRAGLVNDAVPIAIGTIDRRILGPEEGETMDTARGGQVHRARVSRDKETGA